YLLVGSGNLDAVSRDCSVACIELRTGEVVYRISDLRKSLYCEWIECTRDGETLLVAHGDEVRYFRLADGAPLPLTSTATTNGAFGMYRVINSPDGRRVVTLDYEGRVIAYDFATRQAVRRFEGHTVETFDGDISADGRLLVTVSSDFSIRVWDLETGANVAT